MNYKIHQVKGYIQTIFLVEENDSLFLLDGCCRPDVINVKDYIENGLKRPFSDLKLVISTHAHPDHAGGLSYFKKLGISIAGPVNLNNWYDGAEGLFTYWVDILLTYLVAVNKKKRFKNILFPRTIELDVKLKHGDKIPGFDCWEVLECPGHTNMDLTIYRPSENLAYVADNFVGTKRKIYRPYPLFLPEKYKESLQRYLDLGIERFLLAHYGEVKVSSERIKELIESTPVRPRKHTDTLPLIFLKLFRSSLKKLIK